MSRFTEYAACYRVLPYLDSEPDPHGHEFVCYTGIRTREQAEDINSEAIIVEAKLLRSGPLSDMFTSTVSFQHVSSRLRTGFGGKAREQRLCDLCNNLAKEQGQPGGQCMIYPVEVIRPIRPNPSK